MITTNISYDYLKKKIVILIQSHNNNFKMPGKVAMLSKKSISLVSISNSKILHTCSKWKSNTIPPFMFKRCLALKQVEIYCSLRRHRWQVPTFPWRVMEQRLGSVFSAACSMPDCSLGRLWIQTQGGIRKTQNGLSSSSVLGKVASKVREEDEGTLLSSV